MSVIKKTVENLNKKGFIAKSFETMDVAKKAVLDIVANDESVGSGGSVTLADSGILADLRSKGCEVHSYMLDTPKDAEERNQMRDDAMTADWFMSSSNAITEKGELVNIDGLGNRVAALSFEYSKVIILAGKNKIVKDYDSAIDRIKSEACGKNCRRLNKKTPCAIDDICLDCDSPDRICKIYSNIEYPGNGRTMYVFIVNEDWGY